jgi:hypothetical protein
MELPCIDCWQVSFFKNRLAQSSIFRKGETPLIEKDTRTDPPRQAKAKKCYVNI